MGTMLPEDGDMDLPFPENFNLTGAKLQMLSQETLYKGIKQMKPKKQRLSTSMQLDKTRYAIEELSGAPPPDRKI